MDIGFDRKVELLLQTHGTAVAGLQKDTKCWSNTAGPGEGDFDWQTTKTRDEKTKSER